MLCKRYENCPFFNGFMANIPSQSEQMKQRFCLDNFTACARYIIAEKLGPQSVPTDMFPDDMHQASRTLSLG